jgi:large subunit ribosomal protein L15
VKLHHLKPGAGAKKAKSRVGRGRAGVRGKTAGRGTKGYLARHNKREGFEGGQMPLTRRVPKKRGFTNPNREEFAVVNVDRVASKFDADATVTPEALVEAGLVRKGMPVKILGGGDVDRALTVQAHGFTRTAREKLEQAGGRAEILGAEGASGGSE